MGDFRSDFARNDYYHGYAAALAAILAIQHAENMSKAIFLVLRDRLIRVPPEAAREIFECRDLERLRCWLELSACVEKAEELFH
ncbi:hypothetical protein [Nonomuraea sp. NPDC046570]|uniref:hypothetical protein n=1 Tax=Nonomuraea sp. NPDC046570 TaxID=3155255 RepID=UPI0034038D14